MGILEVILLLAGAVLAVLSFVLPVTKEETNRETKVLAKEEIKTMVESEMSSIRNHVDDVVDEAVGYAVEKTERSLERLTNEKIMAVNEYSDTVLQEIHKNHEEAMFLYDMLNAKHDNLKDTVSEAGKVVLEAQQTIEKIAPFQESLAIAQNVSMQSGETSATELLEERAINMDVSEFRAAEFERLDLSMISDKAKKDGTKSSFGRKTSVKKNSSRKNTDEESPAETIKEWDFLADVREPGTNNNEQILNLHKQGKSTVAIAKELGLGVGEVKLVIDLYKNS